MSKSIRARSWVFTINNYTVDDTNAVHALANDKTKYLIAGYEICPKTLTPHIQGYVRFASGRTRSAISKQLPRAYLAIAKGNDDQNQKYCMKEKAFIEYGAKAAPGTRTDMSRIRELTNSGVSISSMLDEGVITSAQQTRFAIICNTYKRQPKYRELDCFWWWGLTGVGKTRKVIDLEDDLYTMDAGHEWMDGYDNHEAILIDDFRGVIPYSQLLQLLQGTACRWKIKGGFVNIVAKRIYITSPLPPQEVYCRQNEKRDSIDQLLRRVSVTEIKIAHCTEVGGNNVQNQDSAPPTLIIEQITENTILPEMELRDIDNLRIE